MGPSNAYLQQVRQQFRTLDELAEEVALLVHEFGHDRAMRVAGRLPYEQARAKLEAERLANEAARWRCMSPLKRL